MKIDVHRGRGRYGIAGAVAFAALVVYLPSLRNGFVNWDDDLYVYNNPHIHSLNSAFLRWAFTSFYAANWHPLTWISHAVDYALWGLNPLGHHLTNIVLHGLNTFLVVLLVTKLLTFYRERSGASFPDEKGTLIAAAVTGLLFGIHPIHVESVAWVSERKDLLCALFYLLGLLSYADHARLPLRQGRSSFLSRSYLLALCFFVLALLSKPMAVSLPLVLFILDWHPFGRIASWKDLRSAMVEKLPFFILAAASSVVTIMAQQRGEAVSSLAEISLPERIMVSGSAIIGYLRKMALPSGLLPYYPYPAVIGPVQALSLALVLGITAACMLAARKGKILPALWAFYLVTLLPVIGIVQVGDQSMADRYAYLPSLAPFLMMGLFVARAQGAVERAGLRRIGATSVVAATAALAIVLAMMTVRQQRVWRSSVALWDRVIEGNGSAVPIAYINRGMAYDEAGLPGPALTDLTRAVTLAPSMAEAYNARGIVLRRAGRTGDAIADYTRAVRLSPSFAPAYMNRGIAEMLAGLPEQAVRDFSAAISYDPFSASALLNRCKAFTQLARYDGAVADCTAALRIDPRSVEALLERGVAFGETGRYVSAEKDFSAAIALEPLRAEAYFDRGLVALRMKQEDRALTDLRKALERDPGMVPALLELGKLYLRQGQRREADEAFRKACGQGSREGCDAYRAAMTGDGEGTK